MTVYIIAQVQITDAERYRQYQQFSSQAIKHYGAKVLVRGGQAKALEGSTPERTVVLAFDSFELAQAFYDSTEYRQARAAREGAAVMNMYMVEGWE